MACKLPERFIGVPRQEYLRVGSDLTEESRQALAYDGVVIHDHQFHGKTRPS
jgi:hypothetical protein